MMEAMKGRSLLLPVLGGALIVLLLATTGFVALSWWIGHEVDAECRRALDGRDGDCVTALMLVVDDEDAEYAERNRAVWALGQLGDPRALPVLEHHYTGRIPDREPVDEVLSQHGLRKAIRQLEGEPNLGSWVWRHGS
jgi:hypothetical protein